MRRFWHSFQTKFSSWREVIWPGALVIALVCLVRLSGLLQVQEWMALDTFARSCPVAEGMPDRIAVISIDEADYREIGEFPLSAAVISQALELIEQYQPRVIGLDIFREFPTITSELPLKTTIQSMPNVVVAEMAFNPKESMNVRPPSGIDSDQVGFVDLVVDTDGELRRTVLAAAGENDTLKYSLALQLVRKYLAAEGVKFYPGESPKDPIQFDSYRLPRFFPNTGGYVRAPVDNNQMLLHLCALQSPYETIKLRDLLSGNVDAQRLRDTIVIIGNVASSAQDVFITSAVRETLYSRQLLGENANGLRSATTKLIYGVEVHALTVKQILRSVVDRPCLMQALPDIGEYYWIWVWGLVGITLSVWLRSPWKSILSLVTATGALIGLSYWLLLRNWWMPVVPAGLALCGAGLVTAFFDRDVRFELAQRQAMIERTYEAIHNGPLQRLAVILRSLDTLSTQQIQRQLQDFNVEIRTIFERMRQDVNTQSERLYLMNGEALNLQETLPNLLYRVYENTIDQPLPGFSSVQTFLSPDFSCLSQSRFNIERKRGFCLFLQEALNNVGKYATGATIVDVSCTLEAGWYRLSIVDNGTGVEQAQLEGRSAARSTTAGEGTRQAIALAQRVRGQFRRVPKQAPTDGDTRRANGTICEIVWPKR